MDEVIKIVAKIDTTKSAALENINSKIIKDIFLAMPDRLAKILNMSLTHAHFPRAWKLGMVVPIPKKIGSLHVTMSYEFAAQFIYEKKQYTN